MIHSLLSRLGIETWKDIPEFEDLYQVSNLGNVRSLNYRQTGNPNILKKFFRYRLRAFVLLSKKGKRFNRAVSVLMAMAFLNHKRCGNKLVVDHINNNPSNNRLYNLQVITHRQNISKNSKGLSKYIGVCLHKPTTKWLASIKINGKQKHLGLYKKEQEAAQAYQNELKKLYETSKQHSNTN